MAAELAEAKNMVMSFRSSDLQMLLDFVGRSNRGMKHKLVTRALQLVQFDFSPELFKKIKEIYKTRYGSNNNAVPWTALSSPNVDYLSPYWKYLNGLGHLPVKPEVRLVKLPFYTILEEMLKPTELVPKNSKKLQKRSYCIVLAPQKVSLIQNSRELKPGVRSVQVVLRICYTDTSSPQEDQYPPDIAVKVNHSYCSVPGYYPSNRPGVEPKRPCRPINLTPLMYMSSTINRLTIIWGNYRKSYSVGLFLVQQMTSVELLKTIGIKTSKLCKAFVKEKLRQDPKSEITTTGVRVSLICPLVKMRLSIPCRAESCVHLQCFDTVFYLQMNEKKPMWMCPICDKPATFDQLMVDGLLFKILMECKDADEIEYLVDGSWCPIKAEKERSYSPQCPILAMSSLDVNRRPPWAPSMENSKAPADVVDLTLDSLSSEGKDEEEDEDGEPRQASRRPSSRDILKRGRRKAKEDCRLALHQLAFEPHRYLHPSHRPSPQDILKRGGRKAKEDCRRALRQLPFKSRRSHHTSRRSRVGRHPSSRDIF